MMRYVADLFCGAGGTTTGLLRAAGRCNVKLDMLAVNHWNLAIDTHTLNHPDVRHLCETLDAVDPRKVPVIATTNFRESLDPALLRRFELQLEVPSPDEKARRLALRKILNREPSDELVAMPLTQSIHMAHRTRRMEFIEEREAANG